jgi:hypothetical protein
MPLVSTVYQNAYWGLDAGKRQKDLSGFTKGISMSEI